MDIAYIKSKAKQLNIEEIKETPKGIFFKFADGDKEYENVFKVLLERYKDNVILKFGNNPEFEFKQDSIKKEEMLSFFKEMLDNIIKVINT